jgi:F0F1-type ATP synthase assembly protein I
MSSACVSVQSMKLSHALVLVFMVYIALARIGWIIASDMGLYQTWSTIVWFVAGMAALTVLILRHDRTR